MEPTDTITIVTPGDFGFETADQTATLSTTPMGSGYSYPQPNITISSPNITTTTLGGPYTFTGGAGVNTSPWFNSLSSKIQLDGEGADIEVNGWSLVDAVKRIEERLNILTPNERLEAEWEELRELGNRYRELEQHIRDKQATWDRLKAMPPPEIK